MSSSTVPSGANEKCYFGGEGEVETVRGRSGVRGSLSTAHGHTPGGLTREVFFSYKNLSRLTQTILLTIIFTDDHLTRSRLWELPVPLRRLLKVVWQRGSISLIRYY